MIIITDTVHLVLINKRILTPRKNSILTTIWYKYCTHLLNFKYSHNFQFYRISTCKVVMDIRQKHKQDKRHYNSCLNHEIFISIWLLNTESNSYFLSHSTTDLNFVFITLICFHKKVSFVLLQKTGPALRLFGRCGPIWPYAWRGRGEKITGITFLLWKFGKFNMNKWKIKLDVTKLFSVVEIW